MLREAVEAERKRIKEMNVWSDNFALKHREYRFVPIAMARRQQIFMALGATLPVEVYWLDEYNFNRFKNNLSFEHHFMQSSPTLATSWKAPSHGQWFFVVRNQNVSVNVRVHLEAL